MPTYYSQKIGEVNERNYARDRSREARMIPTSISGVRRATSYRFPPVKRVRFVSKLIVKTKQPIEIDKRKVQMMALDILVQVRTFSETGRPDFNAFHFRTMRR